MDEGRTCAALHARPALQPHDHRDAHDGQCGLGGLSGGRHRQGQATRARRPARATAAGRPSPHRGRIHGRGQVGLAAEEGVAAPFGLGDHGRLAVDRIGHEHTAEIRLAAGELVVAGTDHLDVDVIEVPRESCNLRSRLAVADPDVVLVDLAGATVANGDLALLARLNRWTDAPVVVRAACREVGCAQKALASGALAFVLNTAPPEDLLRALRLAVLGEVFVSDEVRPLLLRVVAETARRVWSDEDQEADSPGGEGGVP